MAFMRMDGRNAGSIALSGTDTFYSDALDLGHSSCGSIQLEWTGSTPVVTETVWATNNPDAVLNTDDTDWIDVSATIAAIDVTGNSGSGFVDIPPAENLYRFYRLKFVNVSGTATVRVYGHGKSNV